MKQAYACLACSCLPALAHSCFVAVKHASKVMKENPPEAAGGSIILTASGTPLFQAFLPLLLKLNFDGIARARD